MTLRNLWSVQVDLEGAKSSAYWCSAGFVGLLIGALLAMAGCASTGSGGGTDYAKLGCAGLAATVASCDSGLISDGDACRVARVGLAFCQASGAGFLAGGSGYDPRQRGLTRSCFRLDAVNGPETCVPIDFSADPATATPGSVEFAQLYERRWGRCTLNGCANDNPPHFFKRWRGPGMEVRDTLTRALEWSCRAGTFGSVHAPDCAPTETEITDLQATGDAPVWEAYLKAEVPGYRPDNRIQIADPGLPHGEGQDRDPFWRLPRYYVNSAFPPAPRCGDRKPDPGETCETCPEDLGVCPPVSDGKVDCAPLRLPAPGRPLYVGFEVTEASTGSAQTKLVTKFAECRVGGALPPPPVPGTFCAKPFVCLANEPPPCPPGLSLAQRAELSAACLGTPRTPKLRARCAAIIATVLRVDARAAEQGVAGGYFGGYEQAGGVGIDPVGRRVPVVCSDDARGDTFCQPAPRGKGVLASPEIFECARLRVEAFAAGEVPADCDSGAVRP